MAPSTTRSRTKKYTIGSCMWWLKMDTSPPPRASRRLSSPCQFDPLARALRLTTSSIIPQCSTRLWRLRMLLVRFGFTRMGSSIVRLRWNGRSRMFTVNRTLSCYNLVLVRLIANWFLHAEMGGNCPLTASWETVPCLRLFYMRMLLRRCLRISTIL